MADMTGLRNIDGTREQPMATVGPIDVSPGLSAAALERARLRTVLATIGINVLAVAGFSLAPWSDWRTGVLLNLLDHLILIVHIVRHRDRLMPQLIAFGLALGFVELAADAWLVDVTRTLDYSIGGGPMLWRSPIWMPFAWEIVAVQFGYVGLRLGERFGWRGILLTGFLGALNIPFYEEMARRTHWWLYDHCRMFLHTPYYIIAGEFAVCALIAAVAPLLRRERLALALALGALCGLGIFASYAAAYLLIDGIPA
ncbi:MAG: hypothetical protein U1D55_16460 [Phycisphaerae bacterium]